MGPGLIMEVSGNGYIRAQPQSTPHLLIQLQAATIHTLVGIQAGIRVVTPVTMKVKNHGSIHFANLFIILPL